MPPIFASSSPTCPRCQRAVYHAEQTLALGVAWHRHCLKCVECNKLLEPRLLVDHDGEAYCKPCHSKSFGAKGYGAGGALVGEYTQPSPASPSKVSPTPPSVSKPGFDEDDTRDSTFTTPALPSAPPAARRPLPVPPTARSIPPVPTPAAPPPPQAATVEDPSSPAPPPALAKPSLSPAILAPLSASASSIRAPPPPLAPKPSFPSSSSRPSFGSTPHQSPATTVPSAPSMAPAPSSAPPPSTVFQPSAPQAPTAARPRPSWTTPQIGGSAAAHQNKDLCRRCGTVVYFAEEVRAVGGKWHKRCLRCATCSTSLSPNSLAERDGEPYCKGCYAKSGGGLLGAGMTTRPNLY